MFGKLGVVTQLSILAIAIIKSNLLENFIKSSFRIAKIFSILLDLHLKAILLILIYIKAMIKAVKLILTIKLPSKNMFNKSSCKLSKIGIFSIISAASFLLQSLNVVNANSVPVGIDSLDTSRVDAEASSSQVCQADNCTSKNYGTGTNILLDGFTVGAKNYSIIQLVDEARFQRIDNSAVRGTRHIYFLETGSNNSIGSSAIFTMEDAVKSDFINGGTDNVFANHGGVNNNNIERVDFLVNSGMIVKEGYINDAGFLLLERGGNDPLKIAAIMGVDANGNPNQFGSLIDLPISTWGNSGINIHTSVFQNQANWNAPKLTASLGRQNIHGIFVSIGSLGISAGETIYGYALFPGDINSNSDLVGLSDFPKNTSADSGKGGLDLISSGGLFIPSDVDPDSVFPPASAVDDEITTDEDTPVTGNVLNNDAGDNLMVTITGQQTLSSGAFVTINADGTFEYNPNSKFESLNDDDVATDSFSYTMQDGNGNTSSASVTVTINGITDTVPD